MASKKLKKYLNKKVRLPSDSFVKSVMKGRVIVQTTQRQKMGYPPTIYPETWAEHSAGIFGVPLPWRAFCCAILRNEKGVEYVQGYPAGGDKTKKVSNLADDFTVLVHAAADEANYAHLVGEGYILYVDDEDMTDNRALDILQKLGAFKGKANWQIEQEATIAALLDVVESKQNKEV